MVAKIANKLAEFYCQKADKVEQALYQKLYGIKCYLPDVGHGQDLDLKIQILEYYNQFSEQNYNYISCNNNTLKKLING